MSNSRRASSPTTKKKNVISPELTQYWTGSEIPCDPMLIVSVVSQIRSYEAWSTFTQTSANDGRAEQHDGAAGLGAQEHPQGRLEVPRPGRPAREARCLSRAHRPILPAGTLPVWAWSGSSCRCLAAAVLSGVAAGAHPARTPEQERMAAIVLEWSTRLNANDNAGLARLYAVPAVIVQGPYAYRLVSRQQVALWYSLLPCAGT